MVKTCLLVLAGGLAAQHSTALLHSDFACVLLVASVPALRWRTVRPPALVAAGFALFMLAGAKIVDGRLAPAYAGDSMLTVVRIAEFPEVRDRSASLIVTPLDDRRIPSRVRVRWFDPPVAPMLGDVWELELRLERPRGNANPGVFDAESWLFREKMLATGYVVPGKRNRLLWAGAESVVADFRRRFVAAAKAATESDEAAAVLAAVATGERHLVSRAQWNAFAATGTTHLMAISGLHVGLAATFAFAIAFVVTGMMPSRHNRIVVALCIGVGSAALYAWISGSGVPARRAVLMLGLTALSVARMRQIDIGAVVGFAALVVFVTDPVATLTPGFNLSFGAVVLLLWLSQRRDVGPWRPVRNVRQLFTMQVFLMFGLVALTAATFQRFSLVATPVNMLAVPLFSLVTVPLTLLALAIADVSQACAIAVLRLAAASIEGLESVVARAASLPLAHFRLAEFSGTSRLLLLVPLAWVLLPVGWPARRIAVLGIVVVITWRPAPPPAGCFDAWVLDVGQGLSVVVQTEHDVMVYDTGMAWRGDNSAARQIVAPFLRSRRIGRIDRLIVSHGDIDHSGGAQELLGSFDVQHVILGEALDGLEGLPCREGQTWWSGAVRFEVLHPAGTGVPEGNDASCVVRVSAGAHALLLTGDIEVGAEHELVRRRAALGADVVVVPHHGSLTSSSVPFVDSVHADVAIVSASYGNRWGFPKDAVTRRWVARGADVLNTATVGAVQLRSCATGGVVEIRRERERRRRFWHAAS